MPILNPYQRARLLLVSAAVVSFCLFWWMGHLFDIPIHPGFEASILQQPQPLATMLLLTVTWLLCVAIGTAVAGMIRFNAGLVAGGIGLMALSARGGSSRYVLMHALAENAVPTVFLKQAAELALLGLLIGLTAWVLDRLYAAGTLRDRETALPPAVRDVPDWHALVLQLVITAAVVLLLARTEDKQQVLAAVAVASFAGTAITQAVFPTGQRGWHWLPPIVVGLQGYVVAYANPAGAATSQLTSSFSPLARPLPLDYASMGTAGALLGHWMSRRWQREREDEAAAPQRAGPAAP